MVKPLSFTQFPTQHRIYIIICTGAIKTFQDFPVAKSYVRTAESKNVTWRRAVDIRAYMKCRNHEIPIKLLIGLESVLFSQVRIFKV